MNCAIDIGEVCLSCHLNTEFTFLSVFRVVVGVREGRARKRMKPEKFEHYSIYFSHSFSLRCKCGWVCGAVERNKIWQSADGEVLATGLRYIQHEKHIAQAIG